MKSFLVASTGVIFAWILSGFQPPTSINQVWACFCSWAMIAEPWAAGIALVLLGCTVMWLTSICVLRRLSHDRVAILLGTPVLSLLSLASFAAVSAYFGVIIAAQRESPLAFIAFAICAALLGRLVPTYQAARTVYF